MFVSKAMPVSPLPAHTPPHPQNDPLPHQPNTALVIHVIVEFFTLLRRKCFIATTALNFLRLFPRSKAKSIAESFQNIATGSLNMPEEEWQCHECWRLERSFWGQVASSSKSNTFQKTSSCQCRM